jgi:hypothetical protein
MAERMLHEPQEPYGVANPHPAYGKDPNVANEFGHTVYPKWVKHKDTGAQVIVNDKDEEDEIAAPVEEAPKGKKAKPEVWGK